MSAMMGLTSGIVCGVCSFGMHHDGAGNTCGLPDYEPARIMAARLTKDTSPFQWSSCSQRYVTDFLE